MERTRWSAASYAALWISLGSFVACLQPVWAQSNFKRGDSNVDADFDISDPIFTLSFLFVAGSAAPECRDAADSNDDGELDISDPIHSLSYLFASGGAPPAPFQVCGTDPTADELECVRFVVCPSVPPPSPTILPLERVTRDDAVEVSGTAEPGTSIELVTGDRIVRGDAADGSYSLTVPLHENRLNRLFVTAVTFDGVRSAPATAQVTQDGQAPSVFIDFPAQGSQLPFSEVTVVGRVSDMLSGFMGLDVTVNGQAANVDIGIGTNGTFERADVPLTLDNGGVNEITVIATDEVGNETTKTITVIRIEATGPRLEIVSGNNQSGQVQSTLADPLVIRLVQEDGTPIADSGVTFRVKRSEGILSTAQDGEGTRQIEATTDATGQASVFYTLGSDAGCGNNRVEVSADGVQVPVFFCATATAAPAIQVSVGSGNNQKAEVGSVTPEALRVWVHDGKNGVAGVEVTFTATLGGGSFAGEQTTSVVSGPTGHAEAIFALGTEPGSNVVEASIEGSERLPATFVLSGIARQSDSPTTFVGVVLNNSMQPIEGAIVTLEIPGEESAEDISARNGQFRLENVMGSGAAHLSVNGLLANHVGGDGGYDVESGSFPDLAYEVTVVPNTENSLPTPVLLPPLNPANRRSYSATRDTVLEVEGMEGLKLTVKAGSMRLANGIVAPDGEPIFLNQVHFDDIPMPMPNGVKPVFAWTLQPAGAHFDPPVSIEIPNMLGEKPGAVGSFLSFDHDTNQFEIVATSHVIEDGALIVSDSGQGITKAGWGGCPAPPPPSGGASDCQRIDLLQLARAALGVLTNALQIAANLRDCFACIDDVWSTITDCQAALQSNRADGLSSAEVAEILSCINSAKSAVISCVGCLENVANKAKQAANVAQAVLSGLSTAIQIASDTGCLPRGLGFALRVVQLLTNHANRLLDVFDKATVKAAVGFVACGTIEAIRDALNLGSPVAPAVAGGNLSEIDALFDKLNRELQELRDNSELRSLITEIEGEETMELNESLATLIEDVARPQFRGFLMAVGGQTTIADESGGFVVRNIPVVDRFGSNGQDTDPDGFSDEFVRITGVSSLGETLYATSECFRVEQDVNYIIRSLAISPAPPVIVEETALSADTPVLNETSQQTQMLLDGTLSDQSHVNLHDSNECVTYQTSNSTVATVDRSGILTANGPGIAYVTAIVEGITSITRMLVVPEGTELTTVTGTVQLEDGTPVFGAQVSVVGQPISRTTGLDGSFEIAGVAAFVDRELSLVARLNQGGSVLTGSVAGIEAVPGGLTNAGLTTVRIAQTDSDGDGLPDDVETANGLNPNSVDSDGDGLLDGEEDQDADGLTNFEEFVIGTAINDDDFDNDGLLDGAEFGESTDPFNPDTDGDNFNDGEEVVDGSSPTDPASLPPSLNVGVAVGKNFTIFNATDPSKGVGIAVGPNFSVENLASPPAMATEENE